MIPLENVGVAVNCMELDVHLATVLSAKTAQTTAVVILMRRSSLFVARNQPVERAAHSMRTAPRVLRRLAQSVRTGCSLTRITACVLHALIVSANVANAVLTNALNALIPTHPGGF